MEMQIKKYQKLNESALKNGVVIANGLNGESLIMASYNEDGMIDCKVYPKVAGDVKLTIAEEINTTGATKVTAFLLENLETVVPVCGCAEEELNITDIELQRFLSSKIDYGNNLATKY